MSATVLPAGVWRRECLAELKRSWRMPQFLLPTVVTPAAFYALFTLGVNHAPPSAAAASLAGYGVFTAVGPALFGFGAGVAMEREQGLIELKRVSPMPTGAYLGAKLVAACAATAVALVLVNAVAVVAGVRMNPITWGLLTLLHLASPIPFGLLGFGLGMRMAGKSAIAAANAVFLGSAVLGGLWFPPSLLPSWMRLASQLTPSYHLGQLARGLAGGEVAGTTSLHVVSVLAITGLAGLWAWTGWRRSAA